MRQFIFVVIITACLASVMFTFCAFNSIFLGAWAYKLTIGIFILVYLFVWIFDKKRDAN
ncbi:MAG: hypothetical protein ACK5LE_00430 [Alphaproteobacteria bacterium]